VTESVVTSGFSAGALEALIHATPALEEVRRTAFQQYQVMPIPSHETEEWRYTDLSELDLDAFETQATHERAPRPDAVHPNLIDAAGEVGNRAGLAIQHDSSVVSVDLDRSVAGSGVVLLPIDEAAERFPDLIGQTLGVAVPASRTKFTALHAAFRTGGTFVHVPAGVDVELPIQTLTYLERDGLAVFPHTILSVGEGASVTFIDRFASPPLGRALSDAVVEIYAGPGSNVRYVSLQEYEAGVTHLSVQRAILGADAQVRSLAVAFGASLSRTEVESVLAGPGAYSEMLGLYFAEGDQHFDFRSLQDHEAPNGTSDLLYKGVLTDRARAVYSGWVHIRPGARRSDAFQTNRNVVLSEHAKADSIPNLEIENNDVRCGHAASVGPVDDDTLFYLQTRGIPEAEATRLVVTGFFREVLDRVTLPEIRRGLQRAIADELGAPRDDDVLAADDEGA
jgi:Fe-S cluster assembly protein SufD